MPPSSKAVAKRKTSEQTDEDNSSKQARVDSEPKSTADMSPEEAFKQMFAANAARPCAEVKHSSGGVGSVSMEGIVMSAKKITVPGKSGPTPKMQLSIQVTKINASSNGSVLTTNIDGIGFGLPTKQLEASPEEIAKDANAKGPVIIEINDAYSKTNYLGNITAGFYVESKKGEKADATSAESCVPGTKVLVTGVSCAFGKTGTGALYTNAKKISPLQGPIETGMTASYFVNQLSSASAQQASAFLLSASVGGFFDVSYSEPHLSEQANVFKDKWNGFVDTLASKCDALASVYSASNTEVSSALAAHGNRLRDISGEDAAQGGHVFNVDLQKDTVTPYVAPIVQRGVIPGSPMYGLAASLADPNARDTLPQMFVDAKAVGVQFRGNLAQIDYRLNFVGNKDAAIAAIAEMKNPLLQFKDASVSLKMSERSIGPEGVGTLIKPKIEMALKELVPYMDHATTISVFPRSSTAATVDGHFASTAGFDFANGIKKVGVIISQEFLDKNMLGGRGVFIHKPADDAEQVEPLAGIAPQPTLSKNGYQAVSEGSFDFDSLTPPDGKTVKFYVVYSGCAHNIENKPTIATNIDEGEDHLKETVATAREDADMKAFLKEDSIVYAVAV